MSQGDSSTGWHRGEDGSLWFWNGRAWTHEPLVDTPEDNPSPGWYRVPQARMRYWHGSGWTNDWAPVPGGDKSEAAGPLWRFVTGSDAPTTTWEGPGYNPSFDSCAWRINSRCFYPRSPDLTLTEVERVSIVWNAFDRGWCPHVKWADQQQCSMYSAGPNSGGSETLWSFNFPAHSQK